MNEVQTHEWKMMVQSAELSLKGNCPLPGDEVIIEVDKRIVELEEIVKAVAHIGVDFGYGRYELEVGKIDDARTLMEQGE